MRERESERKMEWQNANQEPWRSPDPRAPWPQEPAPHGPEIPEDRGSVLLGILGALLGALVGAIPWFLVSTFTNFYVGWLGFLVGWAAAFGYQKLKGRKSFGLAIAAVVISSLLALVAAEYGKWMYLLCTDPDWQADAAYLGIPVALLAFESLLLPENFKVILPNLAVGLVIGALGIFSAGKYVRQYTDPEMAAEIAQRLQAQLAQRGQMTHNPLNPLSGFQSTGLELPRQFSVGMGKGRKTAIAVLAVVMFLLLAFLFAVTGVLAAEGESESFVLILGLAAAMTVVMAFAVINGRKHIDVDGDYLIVKGQTFGARDIANVSMSQFSGAIKLHGHDGRVLAKFNNAMNNSPLMMQWLREHNIPLRG